MIWTRGPLTKTSGWFNQKPLTPLDESLRLPIALGEILELLKGEYGIILKKKPLTTHNGYLYFRSYRDYFFQIITQPKAYLFLWRILRETEKAKYQWEQNIKKFLKELQYLKNLNLRELNNKELFKYTKNTIRVEAYWIFKIGFGLSILYHYSSEALLKFLYGLLIRDKSSQNYHELLIGYPNKLKEADLAFWKIAKGSLDLDDYLEEYGYRATDASLITPTIGEDRVFFQKLIDSFQSTIMPNFKKIDKKVLAKRKFRETYVLENFRSWVPFGRIIFNKVLKVAKNYTSIRETRRFYYTKTAFFIRRGLLELGKRLKDSGYLKDHKDIFFLTQDELEKIILELNSVSKYQTQTEIAKRKRQWTRWSKQIPPQVVKL